jgi:SAM-dependent methyltransferase
MSNTVERFSNRVANYVKYRPGYPPEVIRFFAEKLGLTPRSAVADIGSGTGLSALPFLENGNTVYGVEPNAAMRSAAEEFLSAHTSFLSIDGTSTSTTLPDGSVDFVVAAQAFHWFEPEETRREFKRILKPEGYVCLIWNERQLDSTPFLREYEQLLLKYATDYREVRHEKVNPEVLAAFFQVPFEHVSFANFQDFDLDGIKGRMLSSSYMPAEGDERFEPMVEELTSLFAKHSESGRIKVFYDTNIFYCQL